MKMYTYTVFDVETPNRANDRMSAIGITVIGGGKIVDEFYSLVDPETHFDYFNTKLTGISADTVRGAPTGAMENNRALSERRYPDCT